MLKLVNNLFLSRSGSNSLRVQVSLFVFFVCYIDSVKPLKIKKKKNFFNFICLINLIWSFSIIGSTITLHVISVGSSPIKTTFFNYFLLYYIINNLQQN